MAPEVEIIPYERQGLFTRYVANTMAADDLATEGTKETAAMVLSYCQISTISCTLASNKLDDPSDVVGASPVGAAPTTSWFVT